MKRAIALVVMLGCDGRHDFSDAQLVDVTATLRATDAGSIVEGSAKLVVTTEGDDDEVWLETFRAEFMPKHWGASQLPVEDLVLDVGGAFPLVTSHGDTDSALVSFHGSVAYALDEGILPWCRDADEVVIEATYFSSLLESIDGEGHRPLCPRGEVWADGSVQAPPFTISTPITRSPPHTDLTTAWRYAELEDPCSAPLLTASGATLIETCDDGVLLLHAIEPPGRAAQSKPMTGVFGYSHLAAGGATTVVAGRFRDELDLGDAGLAVAPGEQGTFLVRLGPALETVWLRALVDPPGLDCADDAEKEVIRSVGVSSTGNIGVAGKLCSDGDLGGGPLPAGSEYVLLLGDDGSHLFSRAVAANIAGVAAADDGGLIMAGRFVGPLDLGAGAEGAAGERGLWIARLDAAGTLRWSRRFLQTGMGESLSLQLRLDDTGSVLLLVSHPDGLDFGSGPLPGDAIALAKLTPDGELAWAKQLANGAYYPFDPPASPIAVTEDGRIVLALVTRNGGWVADLPFELGSYVGGVSFFAELDRDGSVLRRTLFSCGSGAAITARPDRSEVILSTSAGSHPGEMLVLGDEILLAPDLKTLSLLAALER
jgi:hypothetical protein